MDKKLKRNLTISVIVLIVFLVGIIGLAQYGSQSTSNSPNISINEVAGVNNVNLSKTEFTAVNISKNNTMLGITESNKGYDKYHDNSKNVFVFHIPSNTTIEMLTETHTIDLFYEQQNNSNLTTIKVGNITGLTTNTINKTGIKQGNVDLYNTFYFVINNTTYTIYYQNTTALEAFLNAWLQASGYPIQNIENLSASTTTEESTSSSSSKSTTTDTSLHAGGDPNPTSYKDYGYDSYSDGQGGTIYVDDQGNEYYGG
ncbi:MAG: hypothetical protein NKF70_00060 [Methanobacterium sp. ERen5]|nr:MAG: hypothetical protein NKF70_00060 [Methanobacterium sp. ERen5]